MAYDGYKDLYKLFVDGIKITSGSWTGDKSLEPVRFVDGIKITSGSWTGDKSVEPVRGILKCLYVSSITQIVQLLAEDDLPRLKWRQAGYRVTRKE